MANEKLLLGLQELRFSKQEIDRVFPLLDKFIKEIILFNSAYNLTRTSDYNEIAINHILDSIAGVEKIKNLSEKFKNPEIADIGSGAGFPGIPLAIFMPFANLTLVERMDKRCAFLENVIAILGLKNVIVLKSEIEKVEKQSFDITTFRAFRPLEKDMTKTLLSVTKKEGFLVAYKAKLENIKNEMKEISDVVKNYEIFPLLVPYMKDKERNLVIINV